MRTTAALVERAQSAIGRLGRTDLPWPAVAADVASVLHRLIGFDGLSLGHPRTPLFAVSDALASSLTGDRRQRFWQIELEAPDYNKMSGLAVSAAPVGILSAATGGDLARSARWDELLRPGGVGDELRAALVADGRCWGWLLLHRVAGARWFSGADAAVLSRLMPALTATARSAWTAPMPPRAGPGPVPIPPSAPGTLVFAADGAAVSTTAEARQWLDRLQPAQRATLVSALMARLAAGARNLPSVDTHGTVVRDRYGMWLEITAARLEPPLGRGVTAITVQAPRQDAVIDLLLHAYPLTSRERQVAELALAGRTTAEIGKALFVSHHTAADHLKAIFTKTGAHSRQGLAQRLAGQGS